MSATDLRFDSQGNSITPSEYAPSARVVGAIESGLVKVTRRAKIFENDGVTPWRPSNSSENDIARLVDGSISVDAASDERRKIDATFENIDNVLRPSPYDGFWYDKIIKCYRGVEFDPRTVLSSVAIMESPNADKLRSRLGALGLTDVDDMTATPVGGAPFGYDYYVSESGTAAITQGAALTRMWQQGKNIITIGIGSTQAHIPIIATTSATTTTWGVSPPTGDTPTKGSFSTEQTSASALGARVTALAGGATALARWPSGALTYVTTGIGISPAGGVWLDVHLPDLTSTQARALIASAIRYMESYGSLNTWETQLGEFQIDRIDDQSFPGTVKVTGRDGTKKLMNARLPQTSIFAAGTPLYTFIQSVAANGGVSANKMKLSVGTEALSSEMAFERGTDRWSMIKTACAAFNYEVFFDAFGNLVVRQYSDPSTSPVTWGFNTGSKGNLVSYSRSTNDSRVFNHVLVYGDPSDGQQNTLPYFGEAQVTDPTSPVHYTKIGDRVMPPIVTTFLSSNEEAQALAESRLKIAALESYELSYESIAYPWLEAGEIVDIADPLRTVYEPTRFLMDSLTIPLGLGTMTATGKRVTFIGSSGG